MNKARLILLVCTLSTAAWSLPGLSLLGAKHGVPGSWFDGG
jgi:hypothetical protein